MPQSDRIHELFEETTKNWEEKRDFDIKEYENEVLNLRSDSEDISKEWEEVKNSDEKEYESKVSDLQSEFHDISNEWRNIRKKDVQDYEKEFEKLLIGYDYTSSVVRNKKVEEFFKNNIKTIGLYFLKTWLDKKKKEFVEKALRKFKSVFETEVQKNIDQVKAKENILKTSLSSIDFINHYYNLYPYLVNKFYGNRFLVTFEFPEYIIKSLSYNPTKQETKSKQSVGTTFVPEFFNLVLSSLIREINSIGSFKLSYERLNDYSNVYNIENLTSMLRSVSYGDSLVLKFREASMISKINQSNTLYIGSLLYFWQKVLKSFANQRAGFEDANLDPIPSFGLDASFVMNVYLISDFHYINEGESLSDFVNFVPEHVEKQDFISLLEEKRAISNVKKGILILQKYSYLLIPEQLEGVSLSMQDGKLLDVQVRCTPLYYENNLERYKFKIFPTGNIEFNIERELPKKTLWDTILSGLIWIGTFAANKLISQM